MMKKNILTFYVSLGASIVSPYVFGQNNNIAIGHYLFPTVLSNALEQGIRVPIYLKYDADPTLINKKSSQKIGNAQIIYKNSTLQLSSIDFDQNSESTALSSDVKNSLNNSQDSFDENMQIMLTNHAAVKFDIESLYLELLVDKDALETSYIQRSDVLPESTSKEFSSVLNYRFGYSYNEYDHLTNSSNYLSLNSISSYKEHHLNINASMYGIGEGKTESNLYRAMYEHDFEGRRFAAGLMDTWSMQSIANLSALNSSKIYGLTYGNKSSTTINDNKQSLTPITVFLPSAGTVQVYRDGRLLSIQNFAMGSHEVDTSGFPYGLYNIELKTIVDGQETISIAQVNKSYTRNSSVTGVLDWQVFGGSLKYYVKDRQEEENRNYEKNTYLLGIALGKNYSVLSGLNLNSTVYAFDQNLVFDTESTLSITPSTSVNLQTMLASDSSYKLGMSINYSLPKGYGGVWASVYDSDSGDDLYFSQNKNYNLGLNLNLKQIHSRLGYLIYSYTNDTQRKYTSNNIEYSQNLYSNRYADISFRAGLQNSTYENQPGFNDKYTYFDLKLPFSRWFSAGLSSRNKNLTANAEYRQSFNSAISDIGFNVAQVVKRENSSYFNQDDFTASASMSYRTSLNAGSLSASASSLSKSFNYTTQGSIANSNLSFGLGSTSFDSGILVKTGLSLGTKMSALINGTDYHLTGNSTFIPLAPYKKYTVEFRNDKGSMDTVSIGRGRQNTVVLYPGNVAKIEPEVKKMVTIFGRIHYPNGEVAANIPLQNHIGKTTTDENGEFALDMDIQYPTISLIHNNGDICESKVSLENQTGVAWLGDISCNYKSASNTQDILGARLND